MVSGAEPLFNQRQLPQGYRLRPKQLPHNPGPRFRGRRIPAAREAHWTPAPCPFSPGRRRAVNGQIVGADHFGREQLGQQRHPSLPEMEGERLFAWAVPSKRRYFRKAVRTASVSSSPLSAWSLPDRLRFSYYRWYLLNPKLLICFFPFAGQESAHHKMIIDMLVLCARRGMAVWIISSGIDAICEKPNNEEFLRRLRYIKE